MKYKHSYYESQLYIKGVNAMLCINSTKNDKELTDLISALPDDSFAIVEPKHIDGSQTIQVIIELAKVVVPSAISAISAYLVAKKSQPTVKISYKPSDGLEGEIQAKLNDKKLDDNQLYTTLVSKLLSSSQGEEHESVD